MKEFIEMLKLSLIAAGLLFPTVALANGFKQSADKGNFIMLTLLAFFAMAVVTQLGFYLRHVLRQSKGE